MATRLRTDFPINALGEPRVLRLETNRAMRGGVSTSATVIKPHADGLGYSFVMFQDFSAAVLTLPEARGTQKAIDDLHAQACAKIDDVRAAALAHYAKQARTEQVAA